MYMCRRLSVVESVLLSLLFNPELEVPDIARLKQLKERERAARANPFTAATFDIEKLKEKERKKAEKIEPNWKPTLATFSGPHKSSAVSMSILGGQPEQRAAPADAATDGAGPAVQAPADAAPAMPVTSPPAAAVEPSPSARGCTLVSRNRRTKEGSGTAHSPRTRE